MDVERALLDAATRIIEAEGVHALSVRRIATDADVAPMGVYKRFGNMHGVIDALFAEGFRRLTVSLTIEPIHEDFMEDALAIARRYRAFALENRQLYELMMHQPVRDFEPSDESKNISLGAFIALIDRIRPRVERGEIETADPIEIGQRLWALCHGICSLELVEIGFVADVGTHLDLAVSAIARGLIAAKPKQRPKTLPKAGPIPDRMLPDGRTSLRR